MGKLDGRVVLITGAARGQGAAIARRFVAEGAQVVISDVLDEPGKRLADELGAAAAYVHLDVRDEMQWAAAVQFATTQFGHLDGLVNNAGILHVGGIETDSAQDFADVVAVNQAGVFLGMRAAIPALRAAGGGTIVNTSSVDGQFGVPLLNAYCASKYAVVGMTKVAALELARDGIRVNALCPGVIVTDMVKDTLDGYGPMLLEKIPMARFGSVDEIASVALFLTGPDSSYCTGGEYVVDGGWTAGI